MTYRAMSIEKNVVIITPSSEILLFFVWKIDGYCTLRRERHNDFLIYDFRSYAIHIAQGSIHLYTTTEHTILYCM
jgi:hypothetical protein